MYPYGHIDLRVKDIEAAHSFYSKLLPELGFRHEWRGDGVFSFQTEGQFPRLSWFGVIEKANHEPNANRLAFAVDSHETVDRIAETARAAGAINYEEPEEMPYNPRVYYAAYFEDPSGNKLEVYFCQE